MLCVDELSDEQKLAFHKYITGNNIFITGPGGTGKSAVIKMIYSSAMLRDRKIQVCALTGCAAVLLGCKAKTIHSWSGIGRGEGSIEQLINKVKNNRYSKNMWKGTEILVVDEVSMMSLSLFETLNHIGKAIRKNSRPFGGIQLVFSGDFYQLPPVGNREEPDTMRFCFESSEWNTVFPSECQIQLVRIFRQTDEVYSKILNQIRKGKISRKSYEILLQYVGRERSPDLIMEPTKLYPTKNKVDNINTQNMSLLDSEERKYVIDYLTDGKMTTIEKMLRSSFSEVMIKTELDYLAGNLLCDKEVKLKIGAQVMCVINIQDDDRNVTICNGSQGIVTGFCELTGAPRVLFNNGMERVMVKHLWLSDKIPGIGVSQVPLILAWALTIHKSQGSTLDIAEVDIGSGIFECGQTYVALSRVRSLDGLYLKDMDVQRIKVNRKVQEYYQILEETLA
jgi:ATP-dependent DNA helicase PIF1